MGLGAQYSIPFGLSVFLGDLNPCSYIEESASAFRLFVSAVDISLERVHCFQITDLNSRCTAYILSSSLTMAVLWLSFTDRSMNKNY